MTEPTSPPQDDGFTITPAIAEILLRIEDKRILAAAKAGKLTKAAICRELWLDTKGDNMAECLNCKVNPAVDSRAALVRVNETGVDGQWICRNCYTELLERKSSGEPMYLHKEDCQNYCDYVCNGSRGFELAEIIKQHELRTGR